MIQKKKYPTAISLLAALTLLLCSIQLFAQRKGETPATRPPYLKTADGITQLIVHDKPFIMLAGELNNSASSSLAYMKAVWPKLKAQHLNSVIATVSWELLEPVEGTYDFTLVDGLIKEARAHNIKLIFNWFGTWKNTWSTYVPVWVKKDTVRFPRMHTKPGEYSGALTAFGKEGVKADARAFAALMKHIKEIDGKEHTVILMQVENETGVLNTTRDQSPLAQQAFRQNVPDALMQYLESEKSNLTPELQNMMASTGHRKQGTWQEVFGYGADEVFMAWHIAAYVQQVAAAGRKEYDLPMYVNAWLDPHFSQRLIPDYPVGGPVSKMLNIWRAAAPAIDFISPDIYIDDFKRVCNQYTQFNNPLFIPEANRHARSAAHTYYVLGQHKALGFSPFRVDRNEVTDPLGEAYAALEGFVPFLAAHQKADNSLGFLYTDKDRESYELGGYRIEVEYLQKRNEDEKIPEAAGLILNTGPDEFYIAGYKIRVHIWPLKTDKARHAEFLLNEEGVFTNGKWTPGRTMNGDEMIVDLKKKPEFRRVKLHKL